MSGVPHPTIVPAHDEIPFPHTEQHLPCRTRPELFAIEDAPIERHERHRMLRQAKAICTECPIVKDCLKWALANKDLTKTGVWAATTARDRKQLRRQLTARLGEDWIGIVAARDRIRREREAAARHSPLPVNAMRIVRLDREFNGPMPSRPRLSPGQQQRNVTRLVSSLKAA